MEASDGELLTDRWFQLPSSVLTHPIQNKLKSDFLSGSSRYHVVAAGRRSYKTERMKRWFVASCCDITHPNVRCFLGAPTRTQAKLLFWNDCLDLTPKWAMRGEPNKSDLIIHYHNGSELHVVGLEAYKRIEGVRWNWAGVSEYQEVDREFLSRTLEPILNDTGGKAILEGRPVGKNHFYDDFMRESSGDPLFHSYTWPSSDVLSEEQIKQAKRTLSAEDYAREYEADFESGSSRVYHSFGPDNLKSGSLDFSRPVVVTCDFNATEKPMSWVIGQVNGKEIYWHQVLAFRHTNTRVMCEKLREYFGEQKPPMLRFYGDYSGVKNTSNSDTSDWKTIADEFRTFSRIEINKKPCKSVRGRVAATNALLCNSENERRMFVHPDNCRELIEDWSRVQWKPNGVELDGTDPLRTHASDSVDYWAEYEFPVRGKPTYARG